MNLPYPYSSLILDREDNRHWFFHCVFHSGDNQGSLCVDKIGRWKLHYYCFACGERGSATDFAVKYLKHDRKLINSQIPKLPSNQELLNSIKKKCKINWDAQRGCPLENIPNEERKLAEIIGVSVRAIRLDSIGWKDSKFLIPMLDEKGICGIQTRDYQGKKRCIKGSKHGWFGELNDLTCYLDPVFVCEGWSDKAVLIEMGFQAQGRFNALDLRINPQWKECKSVYIVADNDGCGIKGAKKLQKLIPNSKIIYPMKQYKDIREQTINKGFKEVKKWIQNQL